MLKFPLLCLSEREQEVVGTAFAKVVRVCRYNCYACAVLPDHIHVLIRKHRDPAEMMIANLRGASRDRVVDTGDRHFDHPVWGGSGWEVFLDSPEDIWRTIHYVEMNAVKARLPVQRWEFFTKYDGWPFHQRKG